MSFPWKQQEVTRKRNPTTITIKENEGTHTLLVSLWQTTWGASIDSWRHKRKPSPEEETKKKQRRGKTSTFSQFSWSVLWSQAEKQWRGTSVTNERKEEERKSCYPPGKLYLYSWFITIAFIIGNKNIIRDPKKSQPTWLFSDTEHYDWMKGCNLFTHVELCLHTIYITGDRIQRLPKHKTNQRKRRISFLRIQKENT